MNGIIKNAGVFLKKNSPTILASIGALGVVATSILTAKATVKAVYIYNGLYEWDSEGYDYIPPTKLKAIKNCWKLYIPALSVGTATVLCIFWSNRLNKKVQTSLIGAYTMLDQSYKEYKDQLCGLYGDDADKAIQRAMSADKYAQYDIPVSDENELFFDFYSLQYFESDFETLYQAEEAVNRILETDGTVQLSTLYDMLEIPYIPGVHELGWRKGTPIRAKCECTIMDDGLKCYIMSFVNDPEILV